MFAVETPKRSTKTLILCFWNGNYMVARFAIQAIDSNNDNNCIKSLNIYNIRYIKLYTKRMNSVLHPPLDDLV